MLFNIPLKPPSQISDPLLKIRLCLRLYCVEDFIIYMLLDLKTFYRFPLLSLWKSLTLAVDIVFHHHHHHHHLWTGAQYVLGGATLLSQTEHHRLPVHFIFFSTACSHLFLPPCCALLTAQLDLSFSMAALSSFWNGCCYMYLRMFSKCSRHLSNRSQWL